MITRYQYQELWRQKSDRELEIAARQLAEYTEEAEQVIRAEMYRRGMPEPPPTYVRSEPPSSKRGILLELILIYFALGSTFLVFDNIRTYWDLVSHSDPRFPHWPFLAFAIISALIVVSVLGLWLWKKWGFSLFIVSQVLGLLVSVFLINKVSFLTLLLVVVIGLIGPAILIVLVRQKWHYFD